MKPQLRLLQGLSENYAAEKSVLAKYLFTLMSLCLWTSRRIIAAPTRTRESWEQEEENARGTLKVLIVVTFCAVEGDITLTWRGEWKDATASLYGVVRLGVRCVKL